jgi:hypothetical protein
VTSLDEEWIEALIAEIKGAAASGEDADAIVTEHSVGARARAMSALFNRGEYEHMPMLLPADHIHDMRPVHLPGMGLYHGREEYAKFIQDWVEAFPGATLEPESEFEISDPVDAVFGVMRQEVHGGASEIPITFRYAYVAELSDERRNSVFGTDLEEMRQLFVSRYGQDPGPIELDSPSEGARQEA